jgi:hypothetical protein
MCIRDRGTVGIRPNVEVVIPFDTLLGLGQEPGQLRGHGPISAQAARQLAFQAGGIWRRLVTDPLSGQVRDYGRRRYQVPGPLREHVRARDVTCRTPSCDRPAGGCDIDHLLEFPSGPTSEPNLSCACRRHHRLKHEGGWSHELLTEGVHDEYGQHPPGTIKITSATGHVYHSSPATLGPIRETPGRGRPHGDQRPHSHQRPHSRPRPRGRRDRSSGRSERRHRVAVRTAPLLREVQRPDGKPRNTRRARPILRTIATTTPGRRTDRPPSEISYPCPGARGVDSSFISGRDEQDRGQARRTTRLVWAWLVTARSVSTVFSAFRSTVPEASVRECPNEVSTLLRQCAVESVDPDADERLVGDAVAGRKDATQHSM